jgi:C-terminal processing protease CtpA/Prc
MHKKNMMPTKESGDLGSRIQSSPGTTAPSGPGTSSEVMIAYNPDGNDDISTLGIPMGLSYVDETTANSVLDYDYTTKNQHRDARTISSASQMTSTFPASVASLAQKRSLFAEDDDSFEQQYENNLDDDSHVFQVTVPPGKLGMVIDDPLGFPQVIAMKPDSVLKDQVKRFDRLMSVDNMDVSALSCLETSNLISQASNRERRLTFSRGSKEGEAKSPKR